MIQKEARTDSADMFWDRICSTFQCYTVLEGHGVYIANVRDAVLQPRPHPLALLV